MSISRVMALSWVAAGLLAAQTDVPSSEAAQIETAMASGQRLSGATVVIRRGFQVATGPDRPASEPATTDAAGVARASTRQWERIEASLPLAVATDYMGCLMVNSKCQPLPAGSSFDKATGTFFWHVPNAFKGDFDLAFHQVGSKPLVFRVTAGSEVTTRLK